MKKFILPFLMVVLCLFTSCGEIGMGKALDLEAPVITITSPERLSNQKLEFKITGTCSDNIGVTSVVITISPSSPSATGFPVTGSIISM